MLRQKPILLDMDEDEQKNPLVLARYVQTFKVECWDTNQAEWVTEWDNTNSIPPLIRVKLVLGGSDSSSGNTRGAAHRHPRHRGAVANHAGDRPDGRRSRTTRQRSAGNQSDSSGQKWRAARQSRRPV